MSVEPAAAPRDFETFFGCAYSHVLARAIMLCGNREDAEDATQEGFAEAYRAWDRIDGYELPEAWVHRVVAQRLWKAYRRRRNGQDRLLALPVPQQASPEQTAEAREVLRLLAGLPPRQRITLVLFCLHGWSQQDIAVSLRMTRGGVAANVSKARQALREALGMAADEVTGRDRFVDRFDRQGAGRTGVRRAATAGDLLARVLRDTETWVRAAIEVTGGPDQASAGPGPTAGTPDASPARRT